jgi:hypothetical protein
VHCLERDELSKADGVDGVVALEPHGEYAGIICELNLEVSLRCSVLLAWFGDVIEVDDAAYEREIARARLETA